MQIICASLQGGGAAVISGATSTMLVTVFLASARSYVVITLFYSLLLIVLCGAFNGLVVLPVLLGMLSSAKQRQAGRGINSAGSKAGFDAKMPHANGPDKGRTGAAVTTVAMHKHGSQGETDSQGSSVCIPAGQLDKEQAEQDILA